MPIDKWYEAHIAALTDKVNQHSLDLTRHEHMLGESHRNSERIEEAAKAIGEKIDVVAKEFYTKLDSFAKEFRDALGWRNTLKDLGFVLLFAYCIYQWFHGQPTSPPALKF